jgi:tetratricopeptide (TPR) repeat protein
MRAKTIVDLIAISGRILVCGFLMAALSCSSLGGRQTREEVSMDPLFQRAEAAYGRGDLKAARQAYIRILKEDPQHIGALFKLGVVNYREGRFVASRAQFLQVLSLAPDHRKATYNLGVIYAAEGELKNTEKAAFFFDKYLSLAPEAPQKKKILRWKALQATEKPRQKKPSAAAGGDTFESAGAVDTVGGDFKQWLQEEAEKAGP